MKSILREIGIFCGILIILGCYQHSDLLVTPWIRLELAYEKGAYLHQLLWTLPVYLLVGVVRFIISRLKKNSLESH